MRIYFKSTYCNEDFPFVWLVYHCCHCLIEANHIIGVTAHVLFCLGEKMEGGLKNCGMFQK